MYSPSYKIICENYPSEFILDKNLAKEYFRRFGKLRRVTFKSKSRICTVEYQEEQGFQNALKNAGEYNGMIFSLSMANKSPEKKNKKSEKLNDPIWVDDDIQAELEAMSGVSSRNYDISKDSNSAHVIKNLPRSPKLKRAWQNEVPSKIKKKIKLLENEGKTISAEQMDLVNIILSQAMNMEDRYRILDARDKLLRIKLKKNIHLKSTPTVGTCPDMCPEKERLMRQAQHQVALYEQEDDNRSMNQCKAVKQYSRSSADQETPLPHELRPVPVLKMTMNYLLHNIVDLCDADEVNLAEWFHFMWDRTRGIRKDITQQELCCQGAVELVEQCARFHIHCSARLIAEEPSIFDQKINTENLTKCLQTLKYMYHDLLLKGENCPNEAEFRAYIILLNISDGNFMWEVQQLREDIQKSVEVKYALEVYSAVDKNNYVKFFKLVHSTTYLNACILMRYFMQVRIVAIKTLLRCYLPRSSRTTYPLIELKNILAFDDLESTIDFIQTYGISVNEEKTHIILEKNTFTIPDFPYVLDRSLNVVEIKRMGSVGTVICGEELQPKMYENYSPQNSFDQNGFLMSKDILEESELEQAKSKLLEELKGEIISSDEDNFKLVHIKPNVSELISSDEDNFELVNRKPNLSEIISSENSNIFKQHVDEVPSSVKSSQSIFGNLQRNIMQHQLQADFTWNTDFQTPSIDTDICPSITTNIIGNASNPFMLDTVVTRGNFISNSISASTAKSSEEINDVQILYHVVPTNSKIPETEMQLPSLYDKVKESAEIQENIKVRKKSNEERSILEIVGNDQEIKSSEANRKNEHFKEFKKKKHDEELRRRMKELQAEEETNDLEINEAVRDAIDYIVIQVHSKVNDEKIARIRNNIKSRVALKVFRMWHDIVLNNKLKRKVMECSPVWINTKSFQQCAVGLHFPSQNLALRFMKRYKQGGPLDIDMIRLYTASRINISDLTYSALSKRVHELTGKFQKHIFWKVSVSVPDERELRQGLDMIENILNSVFQWKQHNGRTINIEQVKQEFAQSVTYCIERQKGKVVEEYDSSGIIFVAKDFSYDLQLRIFENMKGFGMFTKVPVVIILENYDESKIELDALLEQKMVAKLIILVESFTPYGLSNAIEKGLVFLANKVEKCPPLELDTFYNFISKNLCSEIWKRANSFARWNSNYKICLQSPNVVIKLYNEGLHKLKNIIVDESLKEYAVFPKIFREYFNRENPDYLPCHYQYFPEFWNTQSYKKLLKKTLSDLTLPYWQETWPCFDEFELEKNTLKYCEAFKNSQRVFYKVMGVLLRSVNPEVNFEEINNVLWTDVIEVLGQEKLKEVNTSLKNTEFDNIYHQLIVVYDTSALNEYNSNDWFYTHNPVIKPCINQLLKYENGRTKKNPPDDPYTLKESFIGVLSELPSQKPNISEINVEVAKLNALLQDLDTSVEIHKIISLMLDENLKTAIIEN